MSMSRPRNTTAPQTDGSSRSVMPYCDHRAGHRVAFDKPRRNSVWPKTPSPHARPPSMYDNRSSICCGWSSILVRQDIVGVSTPCPEVDRDLCTGPVRQRRDQSVVTLVAAVIRFHLVHQPVSASAARPPRGRSLVHRLGVIRRERPSRAVSKAASLSTLARSAPGNQASAGQCSSGRCQVRSVAR